MDFTGHLLCIWHQNQAAAFCKDVCFLAIALNLLANQILVEIPEAPLLPATA